MKRVALSTIRDQLSPYLRAAEKDEVVILRHGKPAGVLIGFKDEDDWFDISWKMILGSLIVSRPPVAVFEQAGESA